jgi:ABC-type polysaccharide/polyol phosphate export permease
MNKSDHVFAIKYFTFALELLKKSEDIQDVYKECFYWLALSYESIEQYMLALDYYKKLDGDEKWADDVTFHKNICYEKIGLNPNQDTPINKEFISSISTKNPSSNNFTFVWLYVKSMIVIRYRGAYLGLIWNLIQPMLYLLVLGFVFAAFNNAPIEEYVLYLFAGLVPWRFFEQGVMSMTDSILINSRITSSTRMPYIYFPLIQLGIALVDFMSAFFALSVIFLLLNAHWHVQILILPLSIIVFTLIIAGAGIITSSLFVFFQDIKSLIQMCLMLMLFTSTIFFKIEIFSGHPFKVMFLRYDPVCYWIRLFQKPIFYGQLPSLMDWTVSIISAVVLLAIGLLIYNKTQKRFYYYM